MTRSTTIVFAAIALFLVLTPLSLSKPGLPLTLKADEPAYYLMALSLVHDRDLICGIEDIQRLGVEFPYGETKNLILASPDHWRTAFFGKPFLVSLLAAPMTALFGANGFVAMNMALLCLSVWLGAHWLRRWNADEVALLFSAGFFFLSNAFAYVFWLQTEILCIAATTATLYFGLTPPPRLPAAPRPGRPPAWLRSEEARFALSGAVLAVGAYNKPYLVLLGLPVVARALRSRSVRGLLAWLTGAALVAIAVCGLSMALIGRPTVYFGFARTGVTVHDFDRMPELLTPPLTDAAASGAATGARADAGAKTSYEWILTSFRVDRNTLSNLGYFLVGRHTGLFPYAPFALLALLLFLCAGPRDPDRCLLLASLAGVALYLLTFIWFNWHGGGGFLGNRYFVVALPGFLFLAGRIVPAWLPAVGYALGGLFLGGIVFTPFGAAVDAPTLQAHTRNLPFRYLPLERTLLPRIPGYRGQSAAEGTYFQGRADLFRPVGSALWVVGGQRVDLDFLAPRPVTRPVFEIATLTAPNRVEIELGGQRAELRFESAEPPGNTQRVAFDRPRGALRRWPDEELDSYDEIVSYELSVKADRQLWHGRQVRARSAPQEPQAGPDSREPPADRETTETWLLVGASVSYLGDEAALAADVYAIEWRSASIQESWPVRQTVAVPVTVSNASAATWPAHGATAVELSYHWLRPDGSRLEWEGVRTFLPGDIPPGTAVSLVLKVETPREPGTYLLALDALRERIAWFSERRAGQLLTRPVEILGAVDPPPESGAGGR